MAGQERREFEKYLKFVTIKAAHVIVQSRQGERLRTKSNAKGNDWFNVSIPDDKHVSGELKRSLEGSRLAPLHGTPVCVEIQMEPAEGESLVLEVWSVHFDHSKRDIGVSVSHLLYPRLTLLIKSLIALSRSLPAYRLSRHHDDGLRFTYRVYSGPVDLQLASPDFKHVCFGETSCAFGTVSLSVDYRPVITLPNSSAELSLTPVRPASYSTAPPSSGDYDSVMSRKLNLAFAFAPGSQLTSSPQSSLQAFSRVLPHPLSREESSNTDATSTTSEEESLFSGRGDPAAMATGGEEGESYILVNLGQLKPAFGKAPTDSIGDFLQLCNEFPSLDMFASESRTDLPAALENLEAARQKVQH